MFYVYINVFKVQIFYT